MEGELNFGVKIPSDPRAKGCFYLSDCALMSLQLQHKVLVVVEFDLHRMQMPEIIGGVKTGRTLYIKVFCKIINNMRSQPCLEAQTDSTSVFSLFFLDKIFYLGVSITSPAIKRRRGRKEDTNYKKYF